ncbi:MAG: DUF1570 domain-containing protein [Planctomycetota bacterium]
MIPRTLSRGVLFGALALWFVVSFASGARAQKAKKPPPGDPVNCPYCHNDPVLLEAAGLVNHGGFEFGLNDTAKVDELLTGVQVHWLETKNFKIGLALGIGKIKFEDKKRYIAELTRLQTMLPDVKPETATLDPWLRVHMFAQRAEDLHARFLDLIAGHDFVFNDGKSQSLIGDYRGEGPYLGMKRKYEILFLPNATLQTKFLAAHTGLQTKNSQRWHYVDHGSIGVICHTEEGALRQDLALHGHLAFNLAHNLFDGLLHYSYDTPVWLHEGLAHVFEREIQVDSNSFDSSEGAVPQVSSKSNWKAEVLKILAQGDAPRLAELVSLKSYAELKLDHHFVLWSMVEYLMKTQPEGFGKFLWAMKRCTDAQGVPTGANLPEHQRTQFRECFEMNYAEFDEAWRAWATVNYKPAPPGKGGAEEGTQPGVPGNPMGGFGGPVRGGIGGG